MNAFYMKHNTGLKLIDGKIKSQPVDTCLKSTVKTLDKNALEKDALLFETNLICFGDVIVKYVTLRKRYSSIF